MGQFEYKCNHLILAFYLDVGAKRWGGAYRLAVDIDIVVNIFFAQLRGVH